MASSFSIVKGLSHADHLSGDLLKLIEERFSGRTGFFIESFEVPAEIATQNNLTNSLYGPVSGDPPVSEDEVYYDKRQGRDWTSRLINKPARPTKTVTVIAGPSGKDKDDCVLYTAFGGPASEREVNDPYRPESDFDKCKAFWDKHALAQPK